MQKMQQNKIQFFKGALLRQLDAVFRAIEEKREESRKESDAAETETFEICAHAFLREQLYQLCENDRRKLALIREALTKIQRNSYGLCEECGAPIGEKRLRAVPWSKLCLACQNSEERLLAS